MSRPRSKNLSALGICAALAVGTSLAALAPGALAGPDNDSFSSRTQLHGPLPLDVAESNAGATQESEEGFGRWATGHSIWWEWTSPASEMITVNTCETAFPTLLAVYEGTDLGDLHRVGMPAGMPQADCASPFEEISFYAEAGKGYVIGVDGNGFYRPGKRGGPLVEPPSGEGRVALRIEPSP